MVLIYNLGGINRSTGQTDMNEYSSRSHAIFIINIEKRCEKLKDNTYKAYIGKINLVDLAGSEDISRSNA